MNAAEQLNADCRSARLNQAALQRAIQVQGDAWSGLVAERCPHLFADVPVFVSAMQLQQMRAVIAAVERVVKLPGWMGDAPLSNPLPPAGRAERGGRSRTIVACPAAKTCLGVCYGYDFHLDEQGAHLIEINTNAGGAFLNALLIDSQRDAVLYGASPAHDNLSFDTSGRTDASLNKVFIEMFRNEWRLERSNALLKTIAIVDEQPEGQYLYPEFLLAKNLFERAGIAAHIVDPAALQVRGDGLYFGAEKIDLVYNRLTDFSLQQHATLRNAYLDGHIVLTPNPAHYARYADKRNLVRLSDAQGLHSLGADEADITILQMGVPHTIVVRRAMEETLWQERKSLFFKPNSGYGGKGAYRGANLTKRVFGEILRGDYVAQRLALPGERAVCVNDAEAVLLKYDVRCYVYDGQIQLVAARLYQGQTTNFRTPGGGFALVRVVE